MKIFRALAFVLLLSTTLPASGVYRRIVIEDSAHPAIQSAAKILAHELSLPENSVASVKKPARPHAGDIVLTVNAEAAHGDGYKITFENGAAIVEGVRPRSLLYAAGDARLWAARTSGTFLREPSFAIRTGQYDDSRTVAEYVAELGVNAIIQKQNGAVVTLEDTFPEVFHALSAEDQAQLQRAKIAGAKRNQEFGKECHDADVPFYAFLYGNDITGWSRPLYATALKLYPSIKGTPAPHSWEKASLCPSDPMSWKLIRAYVQDFMQQTGADGMYATFWDRYGIYCQDDRCRRDGLDHFPNEVYENVKAYYDVLHAMGKKLVVRTWSSGTPHWIGDQYVHAPGYGNYGGTSEELWSRVIHDLPADIIIQSKAYYSDCEPDPRFDLLIGKAKPHPQIVEYQESGQTVGRFYFPASAVNYIADTVRKSHDLVGADGGVNLFPGGTHQSNYSVFDDILNSINLYAWRELSWNVNADVQKIWSDWATATYGEQAAPHIVKALQLSEDAVNKTFSVLGLGSSTNSDFAQTIDRKETLLRYTNRYYLPEYAKYLEPTKENIQLVVDEKAKCLQEIVEMMAEIEKARPYLTKDQDAELTTRFAWFKEFAICRQYLDESLWRYRYLRALADNLQTDPDQLKELATAYDMLQQHAALLFRFDPAQKFSCYNTTLGQLQIRPSLGSPLPLMKQLYTESRKLIEQSVGPNYLPAQWQR